MSAQPPVSAHKNNHTDEARGLFSQPLLIYTSEISRRRATIFVFKLPGINIFLQEGDFQKCLTRLGGIWPVLCS